MDLPHNGVAEKPQLNILTSYYNRTQELMDFMVRIAPFARVLLDCGAFQALRYGETISVDDYSAWIKDLPFKPWGYFSLDVIGDAAASDRNYQIMLDKGLRPIPIFTRGGALEDLDRMYETSDLVAIGGLVVAYNRPHRYLKAVMRHIGDRRTHLLGFTSTRWINYFKPYSIDSSSWSRSARYGIIDVYLGASRFVSLNRKELLTGPPPPAVAHAISNMGFDPYALRTWDAWTRVHSISRWINGLSAVRYMLELQQEVGTLLFLACTAGENYSLENWYRVIVDGTDPEPIRKELRHSYVAASPAMPYRPRPQHRRT
jgi:hypothetical protein